VHIHLPVAKARELGSLIYDGLILQLRSMGPGLLVVRWFRQHCRDPHEGQEQAMSSVVRSLRTTRPGKCSRIFWSRGLGDSGAIGAHHRV
jgi:hypothetical protein